MSASLARRSAAHFLRYLIPIGLAAWVALGPAEAHAQSQAATLPALSAATIRGVASDTTPTVAVAADGVTVAAPAGWPAAAAFSAAAAVVPAAERARQVLVVSLAARRVWLLEGDSVRFTAPVAVGKGTRKDADATPGEFATPRGRFVVTRRDSLPLWVPPDWHFEEVSKKTGRPLRFLRRGDTLRTRDGGAIWVEGAEVMRRAGDGTVARMGKGFDEPGARELVVDGRIVVPPVGTTQRQYPRVLGARRLNLRDGYAFHGTDKPRTVGTASSHGCLRMTDADVTALYERVAVGTPVYLH